MTIQSLDNTKDIRHLNRLKQYDVVSELRLRAEVTSFNDINIF